MFYNTSSWFFSTSSYLSTNQRDHLEILLRNNKDKKTPRIKDTGWFVYSNKYYKLFNKLQSLKFRKNRERGKSRICLFIINYLYGMFYSARYAEKA